MKLNKKMIVKKVATKCDYTQKDVASVIDAFTKIVTDALAAGDEINIMGFGKFVTTERGERMGRNPQTGEEMVIKSMIIPRFKPSSTMKNIVNGRV